MSTPPPARHLSLAELREDKRPQLLPVFITFSILPLLAVALRILARRMKQMKLWWDDYLILCASGFVIIQLAFLGEALTHGLGKHVMAISSTDVEPYLLYTFLSELYYPIAITLTKCSILCLYLRIFSINRRFKQLCYGMIAFVVALAVAVVFVVIFQCNPVRAAWDKTIPGQTCFNLEHYVIGTNVPNILADAALIALPIPLIWKLQLSRMRKIGLVAVFLLAALGTVVSILRVTFNAHIDVTDPTYNFIKVAILSTMEVSVGVCCACMPVIYPLLRVLVGKKVTPDSQGSATLEAGKVGDPPQRLKHRFSQLDEGSSVSNLWDGKLKNGNKSDVHTESGFNDIPLGRIVVDQTIGVEHT